MLINPLPPKLWVAALSMVDREYVRPKKETPACGWESPSVCDVGDSLLPHNGSAQAISASGQVGKTSTIFLELENNLGNSVNDQDTRKQSKNVHSEVSPQCTNLEIQENLGRLKKMLASEEIIFDSCIFGGGNSDDEADDKSVMWLPAAHNLTKYDARDAVNDTIWEKLNFGESLSDEQKLQLKTFLQKYPKIFPTSSDKLGHCTLLKH